MNPTTTSLDGRNSAAPMTLPQLRHDIRNYLNAIKLSCALLARRQQDELSRESAQEIDRCADGINDLINRYMNDHSAPALLAEKRNPPS